MNTSPRHQCLIYAGTPSEHIPAIGKMLANKLVTGHRCFYMHNPVVVSEMRSWLGASGIDVSERAGAGDLVLAFDQDHLVSGEFEIEPMISLLRRETRSAKADGYTGLWASGDMTWEFGHERNLKKLLEYEFKLEELFQEVPELEGVCQYHMNTLPSGSICDALCSHQKIFINEALSRLNPNYISSGMLGSKQPRPSESQFHGMLSELGLPAYPV